MRFAKIARAGYPSDVICKVVAFGSNESTVQLPSGENVKLYNAFLFQDMAVKKHDRAYVLQKSKKITDLPRRRR